MALVEVLVGVLLWTARPAGPVLALVVLPVELVYWIGFALPFGPVLGLVRTRLVVNGTRRTAPVGRAGQCTGAATVIADLPGADR